jgi:hypothetical protein
MNQIIIDLIQLNMELRYLLTKHFIFTFVSYWCISQVFEVT